MEKVCAPVDDILPIARRQKIAKIRRRLMCQQYRKFKSGYASTVPCTQRLAEKTGTRGRIGCGNTKMPAAFQKATGIFVRPSALQERLRRSKNLIRRHRLIEGASQAFLGAIAPLKSRKH
jgi:hypothetical protein